MRQPVLLKVFLKSGKVLQGYRINKNVAQIDGFLSLVSNETPHSTKYVALDAIEWFTVLDEETCNVKFAFERRVKVQVDS